jgi:hypothetical protein
MTKMWPVSLSLALTALIVFASPLRAEDVGGVIVRGFVSQGFLKSSANKFLTTDSDEGTFAFTEAALNFTAQPVSKVRVAAQLFARDLGRQGNNRVVLDWGIGEYRAWDPLGFRAGRIKFPVGLYNTLQDADVARPEIFQPSGVYPPERRDISSSIDGGGIFGTIRLGGAGYLEYEGEYGTLDLEDTYALGRATNQIAAAVVPALASMHFTGITYDVFNIKGHSKQAYTTYVEWHPPLAGLRLRTGLQRADMDFGATTTYTAFSPAPQGPTPVALSIRSDANLDIRQLVLSAEYARGGLRLTAEHFRGRTETVNALSNTPFPAPPAVPQVVYPSSTYGQLAYRISEHAQVSGYYSLSYANRKDKVGLALVQRGRPASGAYTKDPFTLRVDVNAHVLLRANTIASTAPPTSPRSTTRMLEPKWNLFAVKATFHF